MVASETWWFKSSRLAEKCLIFKYYQLISKPFFHNYYRFDFPRQVLNWKFLTFTEVFQLKKVFFDPCLRIAIVRRFPRVLFTEIHFILKIFSGTTNHNVHQSLNWQFFCRRRFLGYESSWFCSLRWPFVWLKTQRCLFCFWLFLISQLIVLVNHWLDSCSRD